MNGHTDSVILQVLHLHGFINYSLSSERSITMDEESYNLISILFSTICVKCMVFSSDSSHNNWIYAFQMRWVSKNLNSEIIPVWVSFCIMSTQMIFHITRMCVVLFISQISWSHALELSKNDFKRLSQNISQEIKSSTMWHSTDCFLSTISLDSIHRSFHSWNE